MEITAARRQMWAVLGVLTAYQIAMYGWVMRTYMHWSVVLMPWLLHQPGYRLYVNAISQHAPGSYWLGALLYKVIADPVVRVRLGMILLVMGCMWLVYALARKWWGAAAGLLAALGILAKQQGLAVAAVFLAWRFLSWTGRRSTLRDVTAFAVGVMIPLGLLGGVFAAQSRLDEAVYWLWSFNANPQYVAATVQGIGNNEIVLIAGWLPLVPVLAAFVIPQRSSWRGEGLLLLGLLAALITPAYPRYGRFHLSGGVPIAALISAGAFFYVWPLIRAGHSLIGKGLRLYLVSAALALAVALALPTYYRIKLGPRDSEYRELIPLAVWMAEHTEAAPGMRVLITPDIDPTSNFYAIANILPPVYWIPHYSWFTDAPGVSDRIQSAMEEERPEYILVVEKWRTEIPDVLLAILASDYAAVDEVTIPDQGLGRVTLYRLIE